MLLEELSDDNTEDRLQDSSCRRSESRLLLRKLLRKLGGRTSNQEELRRLRGVTTSEPPILNP